MVAAVGFMIVGLDQAALLWIGSVPMIAVWELVWTTALVTIGSAGYYRIKRRMENDSVQAEHVSRAADSMLQFNREALEQTEKLSLVGVLAAGIAHEIRNPLTSLRGFIQLLHEKQPQYTRIMLEEIDRINEIVNELLLLAKPKAAAFEPRCVDRLVDDTLTLLRGQALLHDIELSSMCDANAVGARVMCDENKLKQVFINLVKNAIEAMQADKGTIEIRITREQEWVVVSVTDQGCGMPQELLEVVGKPFLSTKEGGTGLGLMVCGSIMAEHKGSIQFESAEGEGTTVEVHLPAYR
jgi:two-component system sporulation sensor kinase C